MKRTFYVKALWDEEVKVWYCESDIHGLHIESKTLDGFEEVMNDVALELIIDNHLKQEDIFSLPIKEWAPTIIWQRPLEEKAAA
jgi:hypothetical protein